MAAPSSCKAAVYDQPGADPSNVRVVGDAPVVPAGPGQVVLKAEYAALNPIDGMVMAGNMKAAGWALPLPFTMGYDIAGIVVSVGEGVENLKEGDAVFGVNWGDGSHNVDGGPVGGTFKEYVTVKASVLSKRPDGCPPDKAAAVALGGTTAYQALFECLQLKKDDRVLILGASGAVGQLAVQLAKEAGAWVAATCSSRTVDFVKTACAPDLIINYREQKWWEVPEVKDVDAVFASVAEETPWTHAKKVLKQGGRYCSIADQECGFDPTGHAEEGYPFASFLCLSSNTQQQDKLAQHVADGKLNVVVDKVWPFTEEGVREALAKQNSGTSMGKNVIKF
jgi:NADPH:quinone reductase-like Zn-dependent oxidoreductase